VAGPKLNAIGVPYNSSGLSDGVALGAQALREAGLIERLGSVMDVDDAGVLDAGPKQSARGGSGLLDERGLATMIGSVRDAVARAYAAGSLPLVYGGDCPVVLGGLAAAAAEHGEVGLLFVDGHEDAWPPPRSPTGEGADSELGLALGLNRDGLPPELAARLPLLDPAAVALLGPRDAEELAENDIPRLEGTATLWTDEEVRARGPAAAALEALERVRALSPSWWLHLDLDVLSTESFPAADYLQSGGLSWEELDELLAAALAEPGCVGWTVVIYNPDLDLDRAAARRTIEQLAHAASMLAQA
jgi:arginase